MVNHGSYTVLLSLPWLFSFFVALRKGSLWTRETRMATSRPTDATFPLSPPTVPQSNSPTCLTADEVMCLLGHSRNCTERGFALRRTHQNATSELPLGRVRFPGTASSLEMRLFKKHEEQHPRFDGIKAATGCPAKGASLCFSDDKSTSISLAFRPLKPQDLGGGHSPYDVVLERMKGNWKWVTNQEDRFILTSLRDPGSYAPKWYRMRNTWDKTIDLSNATFAEWIDLAPWRMNHLTRNLGSMPDRRASPPQMLHTQAGKAAGKVNVTAFLEDSYMKQQNQLGPERSEVYQRALHRLTHEVAHFSLFHRLSDSWDLLGHRFCWRLEQRETIPKGARGLDAIKQYVTKDDAEAAEIWSRLRERNRLDLALLEAADLMMDKRLEAMHREKANGVVCNFLGRIKVLCQGK